jgi:hypothetical protein
MKIKKKSTKAKIHKETREASAREVQGVRKALRVLASYANTDLQRAIKIRTARPVLNLDS